jgi:hypothetical protein
MSASGREQPRAVFLSSDLCPKTKRNQVGQETCIITGLLRTARVRNNIIPIAIYKSISLN